jgi:hypothetical protein
MSAGDGGTTQSCVDPSGDRANCGACGKTCSVAEQCSNGGCCPIGKSYCGGKCTEIVFDVNNCGGCGITCGGPGPFCGVGTCRFGTLNGTESFSVANFPVTSTFAGVFADSVTGKVYVTSTYTGSTAADGGVTTSVYEFSNLDAFKNNTGARHIAMPINSDGTYRAALNGFIYATDTTGKIFKLSATDGSVVLSKTLTGAGFHNQSGFSWGGYTDIDFFVDNGPTGLLLYVMYAAAGGGNIQLSVVNQETLGVSNTITVPRAKQSTGWAFLVNGIVYMGNYDSPEMTSFYALATGTYSTSYTNSFTPYPSNEYITSVSWDPATKNLFEVTSGGGIGSRVFVYPNVK